MVRGLLTVEVLAADREEVACLEVAVEGLASADLDAAIVDIVPAADVNVVLRHTASACDAINKPTHIINEGVATVDGKVEGITENIDRHHILGDDAMVTGSLINEDCNLDVDLYTAYDVHSRSKGVVIDILLHANKVVDAVVNIGDVAVVTGYSDSSITTIIVVNLPNKHISLWVVDLAFLMVGLLKTTNPDAAFSHSQHPDCCMPMSYLDVAIGSDKTNCCSIIDDVHCFWLSHYDY